MQTYFFNIYYNGGNQFDRIAVGIVFFNGEKTFIEINERKMKFVKSLNRTGFKLFKYAVSSLADYYRENQLTLKEAERLHINLNNIMGITEPKAILLECNGENFERYSEFFFKY